MAVHIPLSKKAQEEAKTLMQPVQNLLKPADGSPITVPNKDMALGCYYLTSIDPRFDALAQEQMQIFSDQSEAILLYQLGKIGLRMPIRVRLSTGILTTTTGRILFNETLPNEVRFYNDTVKAATIKQIVTRALDMLSREEVAHLIDRIKNFGFWGATLAGGVSLSVFDNEMIPHKNQIIAEAEIRVTEVDQNYQQGLITLEEKKRLANEIWIEITEKIANETWARLAKDNPVRMIIESGGARASKDQLKQLAAMRGLVVDPLGKIVELPTKSNFREGLSIFEYVTSTRGSRKGLTDSALKTADAGYLTRRLVDVSHDAII